MAHVYVSTVRRSAGDSAGQVLGGNHSASTAASPTGSSAPIAKDSLRSGGESVPSEAAFASAPRAIQPRPPGGTA